MNFHPAVAGRQVAGGLSVDGQPCCAPLAVPPHPSSTIFHLPQEPPHSCRFQIHVGKVHGGVARPLKPPREPRELGRSGPRCSPSFHRPSATPSQPLPSPSQSLSTSSPSQLSTDPHIETQVGEAHRVGAGPLRVPQAAHHTAWVDGRGRGGMGGELVGGQRLGGAQGAGRPQDRLHAHRWVCAALGVLRVQCEGAGRPHNPLGVPPPHQGPST